MSRRAVVECRADRTVGGIPPTAKRSAPDKN